MKDMAICIYLHEQKKIKPLERHDLKMTEIASTIKKLEDSLNSTAKAKLIQKYTEQLTIEKDKLTKYLDTFIIPPQHVQEDISVFHTNKEIYE